MAKVYLEDTTLTAIGSAIRNKAGTSTMLLPSEMPSAINDIQVGGGSSELVFKNAFITLTSSATTIDLSPWITDENVNDWFLYGALPYWGYTDIVSYAVAVQPYGPLFRNIVNESGVSPGDWVQKFTIANNGATWPTTATNANTEVKIGSGMGSRMKSWNPTTKVLTVSSTTWVGKKPMILFYREV